MKPSILDQFASDAITSPAAVIGGGGCCTYTCEPPKKAKGNNGFGNGGDDPAPGNSGTNGSPNAAQKLADEVR
jgi:hypothetical protein